MSVEQMHGQSWAKCHRYHCGWEGPIRSSYWDARDDEATHDKEEHS